MAEHIQWVFHGILWKYKSLFSNLLKVSASDAFHARKKVLHIFFCTREPARVQKRFTRSDIKNPFLRTLEHAARSANRKFHFAYFAFAHKDISFRIFYINYKKGFFSLLLLYTANAITVPFYCGHNLPWNLSSTRFAYCIIKNRNARNPDLNLFLRRYN